MSSGNLSVGVHNMWLRIVVRSFVAMAPLAVLAMLLPEPAFAQETAASTSQRPGSEEFDSSSRIRGFELRRLDPGVEIWIESSAPLELVGMEMKQPNSIVLQLPRHRAPNHLVEGLFEGNLIREGSVTVQETSRGPLTKVSFSVLPGSTHTLSTDGNILRLKLRPSDHEPVVASDFEVLQREVDLLRNDLAKSEASRQKFTEALAAASTDNQILQSRFEDLEVRRQRLEKGLSAALSELSDLEHVLAARDDATASANQQPQSQDSGLAEKVKLLEAALADYAHSRYELTNQLDAVSAERDSLRTQLEGRLMDKTVDTNISPPAENEPPALAEVEESQVIAITVRATNLRSGADNSANPVALLASDIEVAVLNSLEEWVQVTWAGQMGWIPRSDLEFEGD